MVDGLANLMTNDGNKDIGANARPPAYGLWADPVLSLTLLALWIALALVFNGEPWIDQRVSELFFGPLPCPQGSSALACGFFPASTQPFWQAIRNFLHYLPATVAVVVVASLARDLAAGRGLGDAHLRFKGTAVLAYLVGPGLVVNVFLKQHWGRPRPGSTDLFGGDLPFVPAGAWSDACPSNCSFVSGEAASAFWLICLVPLWPAPSRGKAAIAIATIACLTSGLRVAFGGHYLSDVVLGGLSSLVVFAALATLVEGLYKAARKP
jgi:membrane-associated phospholipid phosphatase